jgi:ParB family chromosome partitioning protein
MELSELLSDCLDTRVKVDIGRHKGKITIEFAGEEDLDRILVALQEMTDLS